MHCCVLVVMWKCCNVFCADDESSQWANCDFKKCKKYYFKSACSDIFLIIFLITRDSKNKGKSSKLLYLDTWFFKAFLALFWLPIDLYEFLCFSQDPNAMQASKLFFFYKILANEALLCRNSLFLKASGQSKY